MVEPVTDIDPERIRTNLGEIREIAGADVEILAATKYVRSDDMGALAEAGITLVGENRLQDLEEKQQRWSDRFTWDFIGNLQSRKVKALLPRVRLIHSVASDSALKQLGSHGTPETEVLVEVNLSGEEEKGGIVIHTQAMTELLEDWELTTTPFRELWMKNGVQTFHPLQQLASYARR